MSRQTHPHSDDCDHPRLQEWMGRNGDLMQTCLNCGQVSEVDQRAPVVRVPSPPTRRPGERWLSCVRCSADMWVFSSKPRVALCEPCRTGEEPVVEATQRRTRRGKRGHAA